MEEATMMLDIEEDPEKMLDLDAVTAEFRSAEEFITTNQRVNTDIIQLISSCLQPRANPYQAYKAITLLRLLYKLNITSFFGKVKNPIRKFKVVSQLKRKYSADHVIHAIGLFTTVQTKKPNHLTKANKKRVLKFMRNKFHVVRKAAAQFFAAMVASSKHDLFFSTLINTIREYLVNIFEDETIVSVLLEEIYPKITDWDLLWATLESNMLDEEGELLLLDVMYVVLEVCCSKDFSCDSKYGFIDTTLADVRSRKFTESLLQIFPNIFAKFKHSNETACKLLSVFLKWFDFKCYSLPLGRKVIQRTISQLWEVIMQFTADEELLDLCGVYLKRLQDSHSDAAEFGNTYLKIFITSCELQLQEFHLSWETHKQDGSNADFLQNLGDILKVLAFVFGEHRCCFQGFNNLLLKCSIKAEQLYQDGEPSGNVLKFGIKCCTDSFLKLFENGQKLEELCDSLSEFLNLCARVLFKTEIFRESCRGLLLLVKAIRRAEGLGKKYEELYNFAIKPLNEYLAGTPVPENIPVTSDTDYLIQEYLELAFEGYIPVKRSITFVVFSFHHINFSLAWKIMHGIMKCTETYEDDCTWAWELMFVLSRLYDKDSRKAIELGQAFTAYFGASTDHYSLAIFMLKHGIYLASLNQSYFEYLIAMKLYGVVSMKDMSDVLFCLNEATAGITVRDTVVKDAIDFLRQKLTK